MPCRTRSCLLPLMHLDDLHLLIPSPVFCSSSRSLVYSLFGSLEYILISLLYQHTSAHITLPRPRQISYQEHAIPHHSLEARCIFQLFSFIRCFRSRGKLATCRNTEVNKELSRTYRLQSHSHVLHCDWR